MVRVCRVRVISTNNRSLFHITSRNARPASVAHVRRSRTAAVVLASRCRPAAHEWHLGERLIERGRGSFALTASGELLLAHAEALQSRLQLAETQLAEAV